MRFLLITQTPSPNTIALSKATLGAMRAHGQDETHITIKSPTEVLAHDLDNCDGLLLGTLENIGALSGLTKDMFDRCYNDWLGRKEGLPVAIYIRAGLDGTATKRTLTSYANALSWRLITPPIILHGSYDDAFIARVEELGGMIVAGVEAGIY